MTSGFKVLRRFLQAQQSASKVANRFMEAIEFPNEAEMNKYLQKHPAAKRVNHWVKGQKPSDAPVKKPRKPRGPNKPKVAPPAPKTPPSQRTEAPKQQPGQQSGPAHTIGPLKQQLSIPYSKFKDPAYAERSKEKPQLSFPYTRLKKDEKPKEKEKSESRESVEAHIMPGGVKHALALSRAWQDVKGQQWGDSVSLLLTDMYFEKEISAARVQKAWDLASSKKAKKVLELLKPIMREFGLKIPEEKKPENKDKPKDEAKKDKPKLPKSNHALAGKLQVQARKRIGEGMTGAEMVTVTDEKGKSHKGVWKNVSGEHAGDDKNWGQPLRKNIPAGTYYQREALTSDFDEMFGGKRVVPATFEQELPNANGKLEMGSLQEFVPGSVSTDKMMNGLGGRWNMRGEEYKKLGESFEAKKMAFMDFISGNDDRHSGNALWKKSKDYGYVPVAIDNGLTFADGEGCRFLFAVEHDGFIKEVSKPSPEIIKCLKDLDLQALADRMNATKNLTKKAKVMALCRAQALKNQPDKIEEVLRDVEYDQGEAVFDWVRKDGEMRVEAGEIEQDEYDKILKMAEEAQEDPPGRHDSDSDSY